VVTGHLQETLSGIWGGKKKKHPKKRGSYDSGYEEVSDFSLGKVLPTLFCRREVKEREGGGGQGKRKLKVIAPKSGN